MNRISQNRFALAGLFIALSLFTAMCDSLTERHSEAIIHPSGKAFAGSESCKACHSSVYESHIRTPHFLTSARADSATVKGSFDSLRNTFELGNGLKVVMREQSGDLFQVGYVDGMEINSRPIDIVIGSGRKGQTFLYWDNSQLFQLPVSYYAPLDEWCNSPGYPRDRILFNRNISGRCLECHATYLDSKTLADPAPVFDTRRVLLGIDCERCHGPAAGHVQFQSGQSVNREDNNIVNPARLNRKQRLDNCALCHSGIRKSIKPSFSFIAGDTLEDYSLPDYSVGEQANLDVHGNQVGLLMASECFQKSKMDCSSCHNVHVKESANLEVFSRRCMNCHAPESENFCRQPSAPGLILQNNCIDCHMPALPSSQVILDVQDHSKSAADLVRTHRISIHSEEIKIYLKKIKPG